MKEANRLIIPTGWFCPRCEAILAPWVARCDCSPSGNQQLLVEIPKPQVTEKKSSWVPPPRKAPPRTEELFGEVASLDFSITPGEHSDPAPTLYSLLEGVPVEPQSVPEGEASDGGGGVSPDPT